MNREKGNEGGSEKSEFSVKEKILHKHSKYIIEIDEGFEIYSPKIINNKQFKEEMQENGIDLEKCIIISNKNAFFVYLNKLRNTLYDIIFEIDPSECKKWRKRRI